MSGGLNLRCGNLDTLILQTRQAGQGASADRLRLQRRDQTVDGLTIGSDFATVPRILPLLQDLSNPTAGAGWRRVERRSLEARGPADLALALALVHHLAITNNVLPDIAAFFGAVCRYLIIEFIPADDSQVQRMLMLRGETFAGYSQLAFEQAFAPHFETIRSAPVQETKRTLYLMARRT